MNRVMALPGKEQMINGHANLFYSKTEQFVQELPANCPYTVISIIGPQSSGKSYLLNNLFGTQFDVLDASKGRKQTTQGIWIAKCSDPCMIILDVEGMDGKEREDDTLFERQSALFSLAISDLMLLNMWHHDIGRQQGAGLELIKLIFQERVKIEAPKTEIIIIVRDHDYEEVKASVTMQDVMSTVTKLWEQVHRGTKLMSDYIRIRVKDFPRKSEQRMFSEKSQDLKNLLRTAAANTNGNLQQMSHAPSFAHRSQFVWDKIVRNERLRAADQKLAMSTHVCHVVMNNTLKFLDQEQEYKSLMKSATTIKDFNAILKSFLSKLLARYDKETETFETAIRNNIKAMLQPRVVQTFEQTFDKKAGELVIWMLSEAKSKGPAFLKNLNKWDAAAVTQIRRLYLKAFDDDSLEDVQQQFKRILVKHRDSFEMRLTSFAEKMASETKIAVSNSMCPEVMMRMLMSLPNEKQYEFLMSDETRLEDFNEVLASFLQMFLARYEEETQIYDAAIRNEVKAKLESGILKVFQDTFDSKAGALVNRKLSEAESTITSLLKGLKKVEEPDEVLLLYLKDFLYCALKDLHPHFKEIVVEHRVDFVTRLTRIAEKKSNKIKKKRALKKGAAACGTIVLGTAWALVSFDPTLAAHGACALWTAFL